MTNATLRKKLLLLAVLLTIGMPAEAETGGSRRDDVLLSLRIATARKETRGAELYKSIFRQRKLRRPVTAPPPSTAR